MAAKIQSYRELTVWNKAMQLVTEIYRVSKKFPKDEAFGLTSQIRRSAVSVPSNIAEGQGRLGRKEFIYFIRKCPGIFAGIGNPDHDWEESWLCKPNRDG